jgi:thiamine biosynthesis protein ThiI
MAMKRGLKINCIHFSSPPYTNDQALQKVVDLLSVLHEYDRDIKLFNVNFTDLQLAIHQNCVDKYEVTILRRMMLKQAEMVASRIKASVLVTGESLGQVASQTIEGMNVSDVATKMLILRPLITMDKLEIIEIARTIGTYDISVLPFEDCCVIFLPKNPATSPKLDFVENEEKKIDFVKYLNENDIEIITYDIIRNRNTIIDSLI